MSTTVAIAFFAYDIGRNIGHVEGFRRGQKAGHADRDIFSPSKHNKGTARSVECPERGTPERSTP